MVKWSDRVSCVGGMAALGAILAGMFSGYGAALGFDPGFIGAGIGALIGLHFVRDGLRKDLARKALIDPSKEGYG